jgi:MFS family permease
VAGYCVGPLLWGPLSETYGRRPLFLLAFTFYTGFQVGCALSRNTASILIFRFLGGIFASAPLTNSGALLADIWDGDHRGQAMSIFSLAPFAGPSIGPIVAGAISVTGTVSLGFRLWLVYGLPSMNGQCCSHGYRCLLYTADFQSWRWVYWILTIFAAVCLLIIVFCVPETYAPALLVRKAKRLRKETGDDRYYAPRKWSSALMSYGAWLKTEDRSISGRTRTGLTCSGEVQGKILGAGQEYLVQAVYHAG